jgi:hypothetical protein
MDSFGDTGSAHDVGGKILATAHKTVTKDGVSSHNIHTCVLLMLRWKMWQFDMAARLSILVSIVISNLFSPKPYFFNQIPVRNVLLFNKTWWNIMPYINRVMGKCNMIPTLTF